jgi:hypothetical protein
VTRRPITPRRAWQALLWGLLSFAGLQLVLGLYLERGPQRLRDPEFAAKRQRLRARLAESPGRPVVLMVGSSRTLLGLRAADLSKPGGPLVFNFGLTGGGPVREKLVLDRLLADGVRPDLLLVEVFPALLDDADGHSLEEVWFSGEWLQAAEVAGVKDYHSRPRRLAEAWCRSRCLPVWWHQADLRRALGLSSRRGRNKVLIPMDGADGHGWLPYHTDVTAEERDRATAVARATYRDTFGPFRVAPRAAAALRQVVRRCHQEGIRVRLVLMPEGPVFGSFYPPSARAGVDAFLGGLCRDEGVTLVDARDWLGEDDFWDSHHLLPSGAARFTDRLGREALAGR